VGGITNPNPKTSIVTLVLVVLGLALGARAQGPASGIVVHLCYGTTDEAEMERIVTAASQRQPGALFDLAGYRYSSPKHADSDRLSLWVRKSYDEQRFEVFMFCLQTDVRFEEFPPRDQLVMGTIKPVPKMLGREHEITLDVTLCFPGLYRIFVVDTYTGYWTATTLRRD
jgi:hypothetical protein